MAIIETRYDFDRAFASIEITGSLSTDEAIAAIEAFYAQKVPQLLLIDFSETDISQISEVHLFEIAKAVGKHANRRRGGKTAMVVPTDLKYGMGRMLEAFYESEVSTIDARSFRALDEARQWLGITE